MAIKKANELDFSNKKIAMLLTARPGVGKTTLAESASRPLVVDLENGIDRVEACYRGDTSVANPDIPDDEKYAEFVKDLTSSDLSGYDTIVIDSLGKLVELMTPVVIKENPINAQRDGKTLSLKGYGAISVKIAEFIKTVKSLNKDILFIAHVTETQDGDIVKTRVNIPGSTKDRIWDDIDVGGYMEFQGNKRVIHFTPTEKYDAKGTHGITGTYEVPTLKSTKQGGSPKDNHFLTDLFTAIRKDLVDSAESYNSGKSVYDEAMKLAPEAKNAKTVDELNSVCDKIKAVKHGLTSREELGAIVKDKALELGATIFPEPSTYPNVNFLLSGEVKIYI
jgi:hypothetical protein